MKFSAFALLALLAFAAVAFASEADELDNMALNELEPVPRLLAEVLSNSARGGAYGDATNGGYGEREVTLDAAGTRVPTTQVPSAPAPALSGSAAVSAGVLSSVFAAVMALAMF